jgi:hypothetical protein
MQQKFRGGKEQQPKGPKMNANLRQREIGDCVGRIACRVLTAFRDFRAFTFISGPFGFVSGDAAGTLRHPIMRDGSPGLTGSSCRTSGTHKNTY